MGIKIHSILITNFDLLIGKYFSLALITLRSNLLEIFWSIFLRVLRLYLSKFLSKNVKNWSLGTMENTKGEIILNRKKLLTLADSRENFPQLNIFDISFLQVE